MTSANHFELLATDGMARAGQLTTPHGVLRTPAFMPVGTSGAMKGMHWREVRDAGADIVLGNTYHLMLRPGAERIARGGGAAAASRSGGAGWRDAGADIVFGNTYHLMLRPGAERIAALGGLQNFPRWGGPMLTAQRRD